MMMRLELPPDLEVWMHAQVEKGAYPNFDSLVVAAIEIMQEEDLVENAVEQMAQQFEKGQ